MSTASCLETTDGAFKGIPLIISNGDVCGANTIIRASFSAFGPPFYSEKIQYSDNFKSVIYNLTLVHNSYFIETCDEKHDTKYENAGLFEKIPIPKSNLRFRITIKLILSLEKSIK